MNDTFSDKLNLAFINTLGVAIFGLVGYFIDGRHQIVFWLILGVLMKNWISHPER